ncbi:hypothetical protein F4558_001273 [Micromonospora profundi]|uniref:hypothetical protein n=1 Tax=Micromonospora profundi TaxID=1420889 RepID=UPI001438FFC0|nr:hypothetical protein [Micromonospora profundi]NJC11447.1 hypothetical protein [Micromonospora profundi]
MPQSRELHVLLARGRLALDEIFPGFSDDLTRAGAPLVDLNAEVHRFGYRMRGVLGEQPPGDDEGYARFAESLGVPELTEMIRRRETLFSAC